MPSNPLPRRLLCAAILATLGPQPALAVKPAKHADRPLECRAGLTDAPPASSLAPTITEDGRIHIIADRADAVLDQSASFEGNVELRYGDTHLFADQLAHDLTNNSLTASGHIHLTKEGGETVLAPRLQYDLDTEQGLAESARFAFAQGAARGAAGQMHFEGRDVLRLNDVDYTTCPPGRDDWILHAGTLTLDKANDIGVARNATIRFMQVPIFYTPYISFGLTDERTSGFLGPHFGHSTRSGIELGVPYYFNLAPNYDDTLTGRELSDRGLEWLNEFRYLGSSYQGRLNVTYLPNDHKTGTDREGFFFNHGQSLSPLWSLSTSIQWVSDPQYFLDLSTNASESALTHQPRFLQVSYGGSVWRFSSRVYTYQTLDTTIPLDQQPYQRLPQLVLTADSHNGPNSLRFGLESEWTNFYRQSDATVQSVTGKRFDVWPSVSLPLRNSYLYFTPKLGYRYTAYQLDNTTGDTTPERSLPIYSLDSGLTFERDSVWNGTPYTQTLEPRLYYVNIPYRNQDNLPVFDTAVPEFSFYNFFRENRFVGADRIGDTNELVTAVHSRFLDSATGAEQARISVGQVQYFQDQRVNLPPGTVVQATSDLIGEVYARIGKPWYVRSAVQWNNAIKETEKSALYVYFRPGNNQVINFGYRYLNSLPNPEQRLLDASMQWPLARHWTGLARWNRSLLDDRTVYAYAGVEYASCCWGLRLTARHRILSDGSLDNTILFEFELSGLAKLGEADDTPIKQSKFIYE